MRDILATVERWQANGEDIAVATVVRAMGSSPRQLGAKMAVTRSGDMVGSVSGGCVEGAVFEEAQGVLKTRQPRLVRYGVTDDLAWEVGLACGGSIEVFIEPLDW